MGTDSINFVRELVHLGSITFLIAALLITVIGCVKPVIFRKIFQEFAQRKYILIAAVFTCLLCGSIFLSTASPYENMQSGDLKEAIRPSGNFIEDKSSPQTEESTMETNTDTGSEMDNSAETGSTASPVNPQMSPNSSAASTTSPKSANGIPAQTLEKAKQQVQAPQTNQPKDDCKVINVLGLCI